MRSNEKCALSFTNADTYLVEFSICGGNGINQHSITYILPKVKLKKKRETGKGKKQRKKSELSHV